jgi:hypothetical protein
MTTADRKANAFHFQGKGNRRQFLKSLLHSKHGLSLKSECMYVASKLWISIKNFYMVNQLSYLTG